MVVSILLFKLELFYIYLKENFLFCSYIMYACKVTRVSIGKVYQMLKSNAYTFEKSECNSGFDYCYITISCNPEKCMKPPIITCKSKAYPPANIKGAFKFQFRSSAIIIISKL